MELLSLAASLATAFVSVSPAGADSHTFDRAYHAARVGAIVYVQPGTYPAQRLTGGGHRVVFVPRGQVRVGQTELAGVTNVEFRDMQIAGWTIDGGSHITFRRVNTSGAFNINAPASWISVLGGSVGPSRNTNSYISVPSDSVTQASRNVLIDGVRFHDVSRDPGQHVECLHLAQGINVTIRNSTFTRCSVFDLFISWWDVRPAVGPPAHVRIEHNQFGHTTDGYFSFMWSSTVQQGKRVWDSFTIRNNTCLQAADFTSAVPRTQFLIAGNSGC